MYTIYKNESNSFITSTLALEGVSNTTCTLSGLANFTGYYVWIKARKVTGSSAPSVTMNSSVFPGVHVTGISLPVKKQILRGGIDTLTAAVILVDATNSVVHWVSSAPAHATIGDTGLLTGVSIGNSIITATTEDGSKIAQCNAAVTGIETIAGDGTPGFSGDTGPAVSSTLNYPYSVAVDALGNLYIADGNNYRIRKIVQ